MNSIAKPTPWYFRPMTILIAGCMRAQGAIGVYRELPISPALMGCIAVADAKVENALTQ